MAPPFEQHRIADKFEPRREFQPRLLKHRLQFVSRDVLRVSNLIRARLQLYICLDEENIVDLIMLVFDDR